MSKKGRVWWGVVVAALTAFAVLEIGVTGGNATTALVGAALGLVLGALGFYTAGVVRGTAAQEGLALTVALVGPPGAYLGALVLAEGITTPSVLFALAVGFAAGAFTHLARRMLALRRETRGQ